MRLKTGVMLLDSVHERTLMKKLGNITNCPNCGAPITGSCCEYCGTIFSPQEKPKQMTLPSELEYLLHLTYLQTQFDISQRNLRDQINMANTNMYCNLQTQAMLGSLNAYRPF